MKNLLIKSCLLILFLVLVLPAFSVAADTGVWAQALDGAAPPLRNKT